jgi:hypothetical protein
MLSNSNRRSFLTTAAGAAAAFTIVPRHVLGGTRFVAPSDKVTVAYIGLGTQGIRELLPMLKNDDIQVVAVCDPNFCTNNYVDWDKHGLRNDIREFLSKPEWHDGLDGIYAGRKIGREIVETHYAAKRAADQYKGCASYSDFRELLEQQKDLDAVKIMTPDHLHATISIAAMKKGKHVMMHKPIANRLVEARKVIETARQTGVATHFIPWDSRGSMDLVMQWIKDGSIGTLRAVHNWTNRPVWPQYLTLPQDRPPIPEGFEWDLWLGPALDRPYHPHYTHAVFRGWYDFGGGSIADMGHYSLWIVFRTLKLGAPLSVEATPSTACTIIEQVSTKIRNDYSFPQASTIRFRFPAREEFGPLDLWWHDGGMKPPMPEELYQDNRELPAEGMMFVGDKGKILAGFRIDDPHLIPEKKMRAYTDSHPAPAPSGDTVNERNGLAEWVTACRGGKPSEGSFLHAGPISDAFNLGAIACRVGKRLEWDAQNAKIANVPEANQYLTREYRRGWEL